MRRGKEKGEKGKTSQSEYSSELLEKAKGERSDLQCQILFWNCTPLILMHTSTVHKHTTASMEFASKWHLKLLKTNSKYNFPLKRHAQFRNKGGRVPLI